MVIFAYLFWHEREKGVKDEEYEELLLNFHKRLNLNKMKGYFGSMVSKIDHPPWLESDEGIYEDLYLVNGLATLEQLNYYAVSRDMKEVHDMIASKVKKSKGAIIELKSGNPISYKNELAYWFSKPKGLKYEDLYKYIEINEGSEGIWRRILGLSVCPEFCITSRRGLKQSEKLDVVLLKRKVIYLNVNEEFRI
jgi:hypothetical protein